MWIFPLQELGVVGGGDHGLFWAADCWWLVGPYMRDISSTSHMWWDQCVAIAGAAYQQWLLAEPMEKLELEPRSIPAAALAASGTTWTSGFAEGLAGVSAG